MTKIINAMQTKAGAKTDRNKMSQLTQPVQEH